MIVYYPMAHMVWGDGGFLAAIGSVDFAGGNVVHISSGISALVLAIYLKQRRGYAKQPTAPIIFHLFSWVQPCCGLAGLDLTQEVH